MLPEAMVAYLENHGPDKFAQIFLGEYDTPEVKFFFIKPAMFCCSLGLLVLFSLYEEIFHLF
jgi:hypothetical protein